MTLALFTLGTLAAALLAERWLPRRKAGPGGLTRWINNLSLGAVTWWITTLAATALIVALARWTELRDWGLFQHVEAPGWAVFLALMLVSQFLTWAVHIGFHKIPWLWPFHAVHHLDTELDATTTFRNHPLEPVLRLPVIAPLILLLGAPPDVALANQLFQVGINVFSHSNIRLPERLDRVLGWFIVTPDFHRLHHCAERRFTDSNYGQAVPWFDHLFRTVSRRPFEEQETMMVGLEYLRDPGDSRVDRLLLLPFRWRRRVAGPHPTPASPGRGSAADTGTPP